MLTRQSLWLVLALLVPGAQAHAEIYKYYDADGNLVLTDTVPKQHAEKAEKVAPKPIMTIPALPAGKRAHGDVVRKPAVARPGEYAIVIQSPAAEGAYSRTGDPVPVAVSVAPGLAQGHRMEMRIDDQPFSTSLAQINPAGLEPGRHSFLVRVVDAAGKELKQVAVAFTVQSGTLPAPDTATDSAGPAKPEAPGDRPAGH